MNSKMRRTSPRGATDLKTWILTVLGWLGRWYLRNCSVGGFLLTTVKSQIVPYIPPFLYTGPKIPILDFPVDGLGIKALQDFQNLVFFKNQ